MRYIQNQKQRGANRERRKFLSLIARSGISTAFIKASPLVGSVLTARHVYAREGGNKKAVFLFIGDGSPPNNWLPSSQNQMALSTVPYGANSAPGIQAYDVANYCHFHEVQNSWGSHGQTFKCMGDGSLGASQYVNTLDTQLAIKNNFTSRFPITRVGIEKTDGGFSVENGQLATFIDGAKNLFNDRFGGVDIQQSDRTFEAVFEMNARAVEAIKGQLDVEERGRMDVHLTTLERIKNNLQAADSGGAEPGACSVNEPTGDLSSLSIVDHSKLAVDILIAAFKCDLTSVASVMLSDDQCKWSIDSTSRAQLNLPVGTPDDYHSAMHSLQQSTLPGLGKFLSYLSQVPAYFISELVNQNDVNGTPLIESTLFCQITDMGFGADHTPGGAPWILAGPQAFGLGDFANRGYSNNRQLLESIPDRMGLDGRISG